MALGSLECSRPSAWPNSWTATRNRSLPGPRRGGGVSEEKGGGRREGGIIREKHHLLRHLGRFSEDYFTSKNRNKRRRTAVRPFPSLVEQRLSGAKHNGRDRHQTPCEWSRSHDRCRLVTSVTPSSHQREIWWETGSNRQLPNLRLRVPFKKK